MNTLVEVFRSAYPKDLRFDKASQILYAQCYSLDKKFKSKKYIPKSQLQEILDGYERPPGAPLLQLPGIRHVLLMRQINSVRVYFGRKSWLYNRNVEKEYNKISEWLAKQTAPVHVKTMTKATSSKVSALIEREKFEKEVMGKMHVATQYQRGLRFGFVSVVILLTMLFFSVRADLLVYVYLRYIKRMTEEEVKLWFSGVTETHVVTEVPVGYQHLLPTPCVRYKDADGNNAFAVNIVELYDVNSNVSVLAIPCPQMGEKSFFEQVSKLSRLSDAVMLEGITFDKLDKIIPAYLFPLKDNTFPSIGVHHRFLNVVGQEGEPPKLYPAGTKQSWRSFWEQAVIPFEIRCVYLPTYLSATRAEARIGWGRLREAIDQESLVARGHTEEKQTGAPRIIAVPWTVQHIVNLEASLLKVGFKVSRVLTIHWLTESHLGDHFCEKFKFD